MYYFSVKKQIALNTRDINKKNIMHSIHRTIATPWNVQFYNKWKKVIERTFFLNFVITNIFLYQLYALLTMIVNCWCSFVYFLPRIVKKKMLFKMFNKHIIGVSILVWTKYWRQISIKTRRHNTSIRIHKRTTCDIWYQMRCSFNRKCHI